jgi:hypothetical protein
VTHRYLMQPLSTPFLEPWEQLPPGRAAAFEAEIQRELSPEHPLQGVTLSALPALIELTTCFFAWRMIASLTSI